MRHRDGGSNKMTYRPTAYPHIEGQVLAVYQCPIHVLEESVGIGVVDSHVQEGERAIQVVVAHECWRNGRRGWRTNVEPDALPENQVQTYSGRIESVQLWKGARRK